MHLGTFGHFELSWDFFSAFLSINVIDLVLAGDNAVVIAMAVKTLPRKQRLWGITLGAAGAVLLRVACTFIIAQLLVIKYVKLVGGAVIIWIAVKLLAETAEEQGGKQAAVGLWHAIGIIMLADISMSVDNMLAVAGASKGNLFLLLFGLGLSIPIVVLASNLLVVLMDRYPVILYIGAAILGRVGGEMIITDPLVESLFHPAKIVQYGVQILFTVAVIAVGMLILKRRATQVATNTQIEQSDSPFP
jgi:YjbE family integral membrane protein